MNGNQSTCLLRSQFRGDRRLLDPAKLFGLYPRKSTLMVGADADVVVLDPKGEMHLSVSPSPSKVDNSI
jgi:dihydropyrimidinase